LAGHGEQPGKKQSGGVHDGPGVRIKRVSRPAEPKRARCVPDQQVNIGALRSLADRRNNN
jgi:hypothetical protein